MFDSVALNVVISLIFIYLLYSLLVATINEWIASLLRLRAKTLEKAIKRMLTDDGSKTNLIVNNFYQQPIVKFLGENNNKKPAYLTSTTFSKALVYLCKDLGINGLTNEFQIRAGIQEIKNISPETGNYLETIFNEAGGEIEKFQESAELWFNETMERATGWYKRQIQRITILTAIIIASAFNIDTIGIVNNLSVHPELAKNMADMTDKYAKANQDSIAKIPQDTINYYFKKAQKQIDTEIKNSNTLLGLGWDMPKDTIITCDDYKTTKDQNCIKLTKKSFGKKISYFFAHLTFSNILGIILTTLAISLGAPFWFDLLNKITPLRSSKKPDESNNK